MIQITEELHEKISQILHSTLEASDVFMVDEESDSEFEEFEELQKCVTEFDALAPQNK